MNRDAAAATSQQPSLAQDSARVDWLRMDMHLHTSLSFDCLCPPERVIDAARRRGLGRIAVTDHNEIDAALRMHELAPDLVLVGEEVKTAEGFDMIGILLTELIPKGTPARETCERIREQGGVVYVPHPFDLARSGAGRWLDENSDVVDVVEVHNARSWMRGFNRRAAEWAAEHEKLLGAGSDAHTLRELGHGAVLLPPFEPTRADLLAALEQGSLETEIRSSPLYRVSSTWAKVRKLW